MASNSDGSGSVTLSYYKYESTSMKLQVLCQILRIDWTYGDSLGFQTMIYKLYLCEVWIDKYELTSMIWQVWFDKYEKANGVLSVFWKYTKLNLSVTIIFHSSVISL